MATSKIRIRSTDIKSLERTVKNFNAKIARELKKDSSLIEYLPEKRSIKEEKALLKEMSRSEFNYNLKAMQRAKGKEAFKTIDTQLGVKTTIYEKKLVMDMVRRENIKAGIKRNKTKDNYLKGISDEESKYQKEKKTFDINTVTPDEFKEKKLSMQKRLSSKYAREMLELYKTNYLIGLNNVIGFSPDILRDLVNMPASKLDYLRKKYPELAISYLYGHEAVKNIESRIKDILIGENVEFDDEEEC